VRHSWSRRAARALVVARWWVIAAWAVVTIASLTLFPGFHSGSGGGGLKGIVSADTPAVKTEKRSVELFGFPLIGRTVVVQRDPTGLSPYAQARTVVRAVAVDKGKAGDVRPILGALPLTNTTALFPGARESDTTALTYLLFAPDTSLGARTRAAHRYAREFLEPRDHVVGITGSAPARAEQGDLIRGALPQVELVTVLAIVVIVGLSFRSVVAPLVTVLAAGVSYVVTLRLSGAVAQLFDLPTPDELEPVVVALLLGVVTDYVVFFCAAVRDASRGGDGATGALPDASAGATRATRAQALAERALTRSGPIVAVAGLAVATGTGTLMVATSPFFRALGPALAFTVLVGLLVAITLVPAIMAVLGRALLWPGGAASRTPPAGTGWRDRVPGWSWVRRQGWSFSRLLGALVRRRSVAAGTAAAAVAGLLLAASPLLQLQLGVSFVSGLPQEASVRTVAESAQAGFAEGILSPTVVVLEGEGVGRHHAALARLGDRIAAQPGVAGVLGPGISPVPLQAGVLVTRDDAAARFLIVLDRDPLSAVAVTALDRLRDRLPELVQRSGLEGVSIGIAGDTATASYLVHQTEGDLLRIALAAMLANFTMLLVFLRALATSVMLLLSSLLSLAATLGITTGVFAALDPGQGLTFYVPFAAAVLLLAFGSDYNIFTVGHVWASARSRPLKDALVRDLPSAVAAVAVAGSALAASFGLLALVPLLPFRQLAFCIALGILIDIAVVRAILVPTLLRVIGPWAAWPSRLGTAAARSARDDGPDAGDPRAP
jgi:RND superfamily putative drug exporter